MGMEKRKRKNALHSYHVKSPIEPELSFKAKGLMSYMLSRPDNWDFTIEGLTHQNKEGTDAIARIIRELEERGYITRCRVRNQAGKFTDMEYKILEYPLKRPLRKEQIQRTLRQPHRYHDADSEQRHHHRRAVGLLRRSQMERLLDGPHLPANPFPAAAANHPEGNPGVSGIQLRAADEHGQRYGGPGRGAAEPGSDRQVLHHRGIHRSRRAAVPVHAEVLRQRRYDWVSKRLS